MPILERAQLFQALGFLQRTDGQPGVSEQKVALVPVKADVFEENCAAALVIPNVRNRRARKIKRQAGAVCHHLDYIRISYLPGIFDALRERSHRSVAGVVENGKDGGVDRGWIDQRLIAL